MGFEHSTLILMLVILSALFFDFTNGWNDSANAIATVVSTRVLSPLKAVILAAILDFTGALVSTKVAKTIGGGIVNPDIIKDYVILSSMLSASVWMTICTIKGLPISGSHSLLGGLIGSAITIFGYDVLISKGLWQVVITLIASPLLGFVGGYILLIVVYWLAFKMHPNTVRFTFSYVQVLSSAFMSFTHGMNDAQKVMGIITLALYTAGKISDIVVPLWVMFLCAFAMAMGTASGGWKVIKTIGMRLSHIRPIEGFAAETSAATVLLLTAGLGLPASTTHTITGSILGVGSSRRIRSVKWGIGKKILYAWIFTFPITALFGGIFVIIIRFIIQHL